MSQPDQPKVEAGTPQVQEPLPMEVQHQQLASDPQLQQPLSQPPPMHLSHTQVPQNQQHTIQLPLQQTSLQSAQPHVIAAPYQHNHKAPQVSASNSDANPLQAQPAHQTMANCQPNLTQPLLVDGAQPQPDQTQNQQPTADTDKPTFLQPATAAPIISPTLPMKQRLQDLVNEVDPDEELDEDVEEVLLEIADEFIENVVSSACAIAKHRNSTSLEVDDVKLFLERKYNIWIPGFGENRPSTKKFSSEAHRQRMALMNNRDNRASDDSNKSRQAK